MPGAISHHFKPVRGEKLPCHRDAMAQLARRLAARKPDKAKHSAGIMLRPFPPHRGPFPHRIMVITGKSMVVGIAGKEWDFQTQLIEAN